MDQRKAKDAKSMRMTKRAVRTSSKGEGNAALKKDADAKGVVKEKEETGALDPGAAVNAKGHGNKHMPKFCMKCGYFRYTWLWFFWSNNCTW